MGKTLILPNAVIFDWDNTLVDSMGAIAAALNKAFAHFGKPVWSLAEVKARTIRSARDSFPEWFGDRWQEASDIFYAHFTAVQMENLRPLDGAEALLKWLSERQIPTFLVSNKNGKFLRAEVTALGWDKYFVAVVGATDATKDKPAREHPDHALALGGITTTDASIWFVGDSEADMACARNADCTPVFIGSPEMAQRHKIDMCFADLNGLLALLSEATRSIA